MNMYDLVEAELSLLYDLLYTKATVIHTWHGRCIRVISILATFAAFLLFHLAGKVAYSRVDVAITYLLLVGAIIFEIASVFRLIGSTWTFVYLDYRKFYRTNVVLMRIRQLVNAGRKRRWLNSIGQHNVLDYISQHQTQLRSLIAKEIGLTQWWRKVHFSSNIPITTEFKELVAQQILEMRSSQKWSIMDARGRAVRTKYGMVADVGWSVEGKDFGDNILMWHVATDVYICHYDEHQRVKTEEEQNLLKAIKILSNYMGFLLLVSPNLLPQGLNQGSGLKRSTNRILEHMLYKLSVSSGDEEDGNYSKLSTSKKLSMYLLDFARDLKENDGNNASAPTIDGHAGAVLGYILVRNKWELPNMLQVIFTVWVEFLCYAAHHCTSVSHRRQLGRGGDFLIVIRLVLDHNELFRNVEARAGLARLYRQYNAV
jgi:hypothetical protein